MEIEKKKSFFSYFISEISNFSYMRFFRKCSMFRRSIRLRFIIFDHSLKQWPAGRMRGGRNTKNWMFRKRKESFRWKKPFFIVFEGLLFVKKWKKADPRVNPLSANLTKWSNTLKQFLGRRIVWVCLTILWAWRFKGYVDGKNKIVYSKPERLHLHLA